MATNEELVAKKRELLERKRRLLAMTESKVVDQPQGPSFGEGTFNAIRSGMMLGFRDEFDALKKAIPQTFINPGTPVPMLQPSKILDTFSENFRSAHLDERLDDALFKKENPKLSFTSEVSGSLVPGIGLFKGAQAISKGVPTLATVSGVGALEGATFGAGNAEPGNRGRGAIEGAIIGGVGTPILAGGLNIAGNVLGPAARRLGEAVLGSPRDRAVREINAALIADDITEEEAVALLRRMGPNAILPDLGDTLARQGRAVTSELGSAASGAKRFLDTRQIMAQNQLRQVARRAAGSNNFDRGIIEIVNGAETKAAPIYEEVFSEVLDVTPTMVSLMQRPAMIKARNKAASLLQNEGFSSEIINDVTDVRYMDAVKRALDDMISTAEKNAPNEARILIGLKNNFLSELDSQVPRYAEARSIFAGEQAIKEAADFGSNMLQGNKRLADINERIGGMGESELDAARMGFLDWLEGSLDNQSVRRNTLTQKFAEVPKFRGVIEALFPSPDQAMRFLERASSQAQFARTRNTITGGSSTARILADRNALEPGALQVITDAATGEGLISNAFRLIRGNAKLSPEVVEEMAKILFNPRLSSGDLTQQAAMRTFDNLFPSVSTVRGASAGLLGSQSHDSDIGGFANGILGQK